MASGTKRSGAPAGTPSTVLSGRNSFFETGRSWFHGSRYGGFESFLEVRILEVCGGHSTVQRPRRRGDGGFLIIRTCEYTRSRLELRTQEAVWNCVDSGTKLCGAPAGAATAGSAGAATVVASVDAAARARCFLNPNP